MTKELRLKNFPISFFSITLGLAGFSVALQKAEEVLHFNYNLSYFLSGLTAFMFVLTAFIYIAKWIKFPEEVKSEFRNPIKINFFPIIAKVTLLSSIILWGYHMPELSKYAWFVGASLQLIFSLVIVTVWMHHPHFEIKHISPALFIPIVGNIIVPITGSVHFNLEVSWFFFSIGIILWIIFTTIVFNRIIFHEPLPDKLVPTFLILMAPPAIGFIAYVKLTGQVDIFSKVLYYFSLFMFFVFLAQVKYFSQVKFFLSSWAYSFPMDAFTIATIFMYHKTGFVFFKYLAIFELVLLTSIILFLTFKTSKAILNKEICVEEDE